MTAKCTFGGCRLRACRNPTRGHVGRRGWRLDEAVRPHVCMQSIHTVHARYAYYACMVFVSCMHTMHSYYVCALFMVPVCALFMVPYICIHTSMHTYTFMHAARYDCTMQSCIIHTHACMYACTDARAHPKCMQAYQLSTVHQLSIAGRRSHSGR